MKQLLKAWWWRPLTDRGDEEFHRLSGCFCSPKALHLSDVACHARVQPGSDHHPWWPPPSLPPPPPPPSPFCWVSPGQQRATMNGVKRRLRSTRMPLPNKTCRNAFAYFVASQPHYDTTCFISEPMSCQQLVITLNSARNFTIISRILHSW